MLTFNFLFFAKIFVKRRPLKGNQDDEEEDDYLVAAEGCAKYTTQSTIYL